MAEMERRNGGDKELVITTLSEARGLANGMLRHLCSPVLCCYFFPASTARFRWVNLPRWTATVDCFLRAFTKDSG